MKAAIQQSLAADGAMACFSSNFFPSAWMPLVAFIWVSGVVGGFPYAVLGALLLWWGRGKSDVQFKRALLLSPVLMLPVFFASLVIFILITQGFGDEAEPVEVLKMLLIYVSFILVFGYAYVLLVLGAVFALKRMGLITPSPAI